VRKLVLRMPTSLDGFIAEAGSDVGFGSWSEELQPFYANSFGLPRARQRGQAWESARGLRSARPI
jgi:hypothetical protein